MQQVIIGSWKLCALAEAYRQLWFFSCNLLLHYLGVMLPPTRPSPGAQLPRTSFFLSFNREEVAAGWRLGIPRKLFAPSSA